MEYGEYIKVLRKQKGLYQSEIADALICSIQAVSKYESGSIRIGIEYLDSLCKVFHIHIDDFVFMNLDAARYEEELVFSPSKLSKYITYLRQRRRMTQKELSERLGMSFKKVSKWETELSLPSIEELIKLAEFFQVDVRDFYYVSEGIDESYIKLRKKRKN